MLANLLILLARPGWFEHPTCGFVVRRSIHLSYGRFAPSPPLRVAEPILLPISGKGSHKSREWRDTLDHKLLTLG